LETTMKLRIVAIVFGVYMIVDGFGSILVYPMQPLWPDHFVRICRMVGGVIEIILGVTIGVLIWASLERQRTTNDPSPELPYSEFMRDPLA